MLVTARSWKFESSSGHQFKSKVKTLDFTETRESGFLRFWHLKTTHAPCRSSPHKAHLRSNIVYHCYKFLQCDSEEPCE
ncbi:hypothetical protein EMIT0P258_30396 [Pseudomonas sp. IT-P258]